MESLHQGIGEGLFLVYVVVIAVVLVMGRRGRTAPPWLLGVAHGLLGLQVAVGALLFLEDPDRIPWYHPLLGLLALLSLGLAPVLRERLGRPTGLVAALGVTAVLALAAMITATTA